jgi:hypothetical protein
MKKIIKLLLLLVISLTVNSKDVCTSTCPVKALEAKLKISSSDPGIDENDWILNTRFKY